MLMRLLIVWLVSVIGAIAGGAVAAITVRAWCRRVLRDPGLGDC
jgi:hypothetical protein